MRPISKVLLYFFAFGISGYVLYTYTSLPLGVHLHPDMRANFVTHRLVIYTHIFASVVALLLGPLQFTDRIRESHPNFHRWTGRVYLSVGVLVGGVAALYMAQFAFGGIVARLGFALLAICWLSTGFFAYRAIRKGDINSHRAWMTRNFALTFAAVTLRVYVPLSLVAGLSFETVYPIIAWACWIPNLIFAQWRVKHLPAL